MLKLADGEKHVTSFRGSHFLLLLDLLLLLLVVLHNLQPLSLHQAPLLDVELLFCLQGETKINQKETLHHSIIGHFKP